MRFFLSISVPQVRTRYTKCYKKVCAAVFLRILQGSSSIVIGRYYVPLPDVPLFINHSDVSEGIPRLRLAVCTLLLGLEEDVFITLEPDQANMRANLT